NPTAAMYTGLTDLDQQGNIVPGIAESWEPNQDLTAWVFRLRKGVLFHNGREVDAEAVKLNLLRIKAGSFSFRTWGCTAGANELKGFVPHGVLLARHASHEPKPFSKVDPYDSTASAPHRGLRRDSRLSPLSG